MFLWEHKISLALFNCYASISKSVTFDIAYLMINNSIFVNEAYNKIKNKLYLIKSWFYVCLNIFFIVGLINFFALVFCLKAKVHIFISFCNLSDAYSSASPF
jgi:hypothetical protein